MSRSPEPQHREPGPPEPHEEAEGCHNVGDGEGGEADHDLVQAGDGRHHLQRLLAPLPPLLPGHHSSTAQ